MNLIKAINSGREICDPTSTDESYCKWHKPSDRTYPPYLITRDTWEVNEPRATITRTMLMDAAGRATIFAKGDLTYVEVKSLALQLGLGPKE